MYAKEWCHTGYSVFILLGVILVTYCNGSVRIDSTAIIKELFILVCLLLFEDISFNFILRISLNNTIYGLL